MKKEEFSQQLAHHLNEEGLGKFHLMMEHERKTRPKVPHNEVVVMAEEASDSVSAPDDTKTDLVLTEKISAVEQPHIPSHLLNNPDLPSSSLPSEDALPEDAEQTEQVEQKPTVISMEISTFEESEDASEMEESWQEVKRTPPRMPKLSMILFTGVCVFALVFVTLFLVQAIF